MNRFLLSIALVASLATSPVRAYEQQRDGLRDLAVELAALIDQVDAVEASPDNAGRYEVDFEALRRELEIVRQGMLDAANNPISVRRKARELLPNLSGDYLK